jgi:hypothetical protein
LVVLVAVVVLLRLLHVTAGLGWLCIALRCSAAVIRFT